MDSQNEIDQFTPTQEQMDPHISIESQGFFDPENISQLRAESYGDLVEQAIAEAPKHGFKLCKKCMSRFPIILYCWKGGRMRGNTQKTGCPFKLAISYQSQDRFDLVKSNLQHNHPLFETDDQNEVQ